MIFKDFNKKLSDQHNDCPCRHAVTMKKIMAQLVEGGKTLAVDHYLFLFLKFIASVIPTMEYDFTLPA